VGECSQVCSGNYLLGGHFSWVNVRENSLRGECLGVCLAGILGEGELLRGNDWENCTELQIYIQQL